MRLFSPFCFWLCFYHTILSFAKQNSVASAKLVLQRLSYRIEFCKAKLGSVREICFAAFIIPYFSLAHKFFFQHLRKNGSLDNFHEYKLFCLVYLPINCFRKKQIFFPYGSESLRIRKPHRRRIAFEPFKPVSPFPVIGNDDLQTGHRRCPNRIVVH